MVNKLRHLSPAQQVTCATTLILVQLVSDPSNTYDLWLAVAHGSQYNRCSLTNLKIFAFHSQLTPAAMICANDEDSQSLWAASPVAKYIADVQAVNEPLGIYGMGQ